MSKKRIDEIFELVSIKIGKSGSPKRAKEYILALYGIILEQLMLNGKMYIPKFGTFVIKQKEEKVLKVGDPINGGTKYVYVEPRNYIEFTPSNYFDRSVNENDFKLKKEKKPMQKQEKKRKSKKDKSINFTITELLNKASERNNNG